MPPAFPLCHPYVERGEPRGILSGAVDPARPYRSHASRIRDRQVYVIEVSPFSAVLEDSGILRQLDIDLIPKLPPVSKHLAEANGFDEGPSLVRVAQSAAQLALGHVRPAKVLQRILVGFERHLAKSSRPGVE